MPTQQQLAEPLTTSSQANLYGLTVDLVDEWWPHVVYFLERAVERSDDKYDIESVYRFVMEKKFQLWVAVTDRIVAAGITTVQEFPCKKVCVLMFLGGEDMPTWDHTIKELENVAKNEWGCDYLEVMGRKGWTKILPDYETTYITLRKRLEG